MHANICMSRQGKEVNRGKDREEEKGEGGGKMVGLGM